MIAVDRFHRTYECQFCGQVTDHFIDFIEYCPDTHKVTVDITCSSCYDESSRIGMKYKFLRIKLKAKDWFEMIPSNLKPKSS